MGALGPVGLVITGGIDQDMEVDITIGIIEVQTNPHIIRDLLMALEIHHRNDRAQAHHHLEHELLPALEELPGDKFRRNILAIHACGVTVLYVFSVQTDMFIFIKIKKKKVRDYS